MEQKTRSEILGKLLDLMTAAFGLVAALAWNDAVQTLFRVIFGERSGLIAKFVYAILVTVLVVLLTRMISRKATKKDS